MRREHYEACAAFIQKTPARRRFFIGADRYLAWVTASLYALMLLFVWRHRREWLADALWIPAAVLVSVTLLRLLFRQPRPFERLHFEPIVAHRGGASFPSRHAASSAAIACLGWMLWWPFGIVASLVAVAVSTLRVVLGIHQPKDVIAGVLLALLWSAVGFIYL